MKYIKIISYNTTPQHRLGLAGSLLDLIEETINREILTKYTFPKIKSTELEVFLDSEVKTNERKVIQLSKTGRGEYFTFRFFVPYHVVTKNGVVIIPEFINQFMEAIRDALSQFNIVPDELIDKIKEQLIAETKDKMEYEYVMPEQQKQLRKIIDQVKQEFEAKKLHKSI